MSAGRTAGVAVIAALGAALFTPSGRATAQPEPDDPVSDDLPLAEGEWAGEVLIGGEYLEQGTTALGPYSDFVTPVAGSISVSLFVVQDGVVGGGTMDVDVDWSRAQTSTAEDGSHTAGSGHQEDAQMSLSGSLVELIAKGTLDDERSVIADGSAVPEVSGIQTSEVEWLFRASEYSCGLITGWMTESTGQADFMSFVTVPQDAEDVTYNRLYAISRLWPAGRPEADTADLKQRINDLDTTVRAVTAGEIPDPVSVVTLAIQLTNLRRELADLPWCADELGIGQVGSGDGWFAEIFRVLLSSALESHDRYETRELIDLLNAAGAAGALAGPGKTGIGLVGQFEQALMDHLGEAVNGGDKPLVEEIAAVAARYAFTDLHQFAVAALESWPG